MLVAQSPAADAADQGLRLLLSQSHVRGAAAQGQGLPLSQCPVAGALELCQQHDVLQQTQPQHHPMQRLRQTAGLGVTHRTGAPLLQDCQQLCWHASCHGLGLD